MRCWLALMLAVLAGCGDEALPPTASTDPPPCRPGELQQEDESCQAAGLPPDMPCAPGELELEGGGCLPAGIPPDGCALGFVYDVDAGCVPVLPSGPCAPGTMAVPGDARCHPVAPCAPGTWGDIPIASDTQHVDASYDPTQGGPSDGSASRPWTSIQSGVDAAEADAIVAIAAGVYPEDVEIAQKSLTLWGVCPDLVEVVGSGAVQPAVFVRPGADGTVVRGLGFRGAPAGVVVSGAVDVTIERIAVYESQLGGVFLQDDLGVTSATLRDSLLDRNTTAAITVIGAELRVEGCSVTASQPGAQNVFGRGLSVQLGGQGQPATLALHGSLVADNREYGVYVVDSAATIDATVVRGTQLADGRSVGIGVARGTAARPQASLSLSGSVVELQQSGVVVEAAEATIERSVVRGTPEPPGDDGGRGVQVLVDLRLSEPADVIVTSSLIEGHQQLGMLVAASDATVEATRFRDNGFGALPKWGTGIAVQLAPETGVPGRLSMRGSVVEQTRGAGIGLAGSEAVVDSTVVRASEIDTEGGEGFGVSAALDASLRQPSTLTLERSLIEGSHSVGVVVLGNSRGEVEASVVRGTMANGAGLLGHGVHAESNGAIEAPALLYLRGVLVEQSSSAGVGVIGAQSTLEGCVVRDTQSNVHGSFGDGVIAMHYGAPARAVVTSTIIERSARAGISNFGSRVSMGDSALLCQPIDLDAEVHDGVAHAFENRGGNACGCPDATDPCQAASTGLAPPAPLE